MTTYEVTNEFPFEKMVLGQPQAMQGGGSYFTKLTIDNSPILLQLPKCNLKSGIVKTKRVTYCDLMYGINSFEGPLSDWVEKLEESCQNLIDTKKHLWFSNDLTRDDLETMMSSVVRLYRSGTKALMRTYIDVSRRNGNLKCHIYDENERILDSTNVSDKSVVIPLIQIEGIKFTSRSFDVELKLSQMMVLEEKVDEVSSKGCMIRRNIKKTDESSSKSSENNSDNNSIDSVNVVTELSAPVKVENTLEKVEVADVGENTKEIDISLGNMGLEEVKLDTDNLANAEIEVESAENESEETEDGTSALSEVTMEDMSDSSETGLQEVTNEVENEIKDLTKSEDIQEIDLDVKDDSETITLKKPNEVYYEIYRAAREKAKHMRKVALEAYLEAKQIKTKYMLEDLEDSDEEFDFTENEVSAGTGV